MRRIAIMQPTYLPWSGYFDLMDQVERFVLLDSVQFEKQSWQQRNRIKGPGGLQWITLPVRRRFGQKICEVELREQTFLDSHLRAIELAYRRAPYFEKYFSALAAELRKAAQAEKLVELNVALIEWMMAAFGIKARVVRSSQMKAGGKRTELLVNLCRELGANEYLSTPGSAAYLLSEMALFREQNISVFFQNYEPVEYRQLFPPFVQNASAMDLLFNEGERALEIIRRGRQEAVPAEAYFAKIAAH